MNYSRLLVTATALTALAACQPKTAATTPCGYLPRIATVNGSPITRDFYEFYIKGITGKTAADLTAQQRRRARQSHPRQAHRRGGLKEGLDKSGTPTTCSAHAPERARAGRFGQVPEGPAAHRAELHAEYDTQIGAMPKLEYHARNILVSTEAFAESVIARAREGREVRGRGQEGVHGPPKTNAGDLGWFTPDRMLPELSAAVLTLKPGEYTHKPIKSQYGWHVVQLIETRDLTPPPFDQVKQRLVQVVQAKKFRAYQDELMRTAKIEKTEPGRRCRARPPAAPAAGRPRRLRPATPAEELARHVWWRCAARRRHPPLTQSPPSSFSSAASSSTGTPSSWALASFEPASRPATR